MYLVFPVIVIVLSAMFILWLWKELEGKHCQCYYDYSDDELRFMYENGQGHLTLFCIVFV